MALKIGNEEYAVDILAIKEIVRWTEITRVPKAPPFVIGVINLRGNVIPVIDSHLRLNVSQNEITAFTRTVIFQLEDIVVGFNVDQVIEVISINDEQIEKSQLIAESDNKFIKGIGKIDDRLLMILDLHKIIDFNL